jgi:hypothetical protein
MRDTAKTIETLIACLENANYLNNCKYCDLGDVGNEIGLALGQFLLPNDDEKELWGWDKESLINGINHGISIVDGTH